MDNRLIIVYDVVVHEQKLNFKRWHYFMEIGTLIKAARKNSGLTQEQAAEALDVSRQTLSNWENGKTYPDIISVITMSDLYSVSLDYLLKEETSMKQSYREYLEETSYYAWLRCVGI